MIARRLQARLHDLLARYPAVVLLGARQVGKTTLAHQIAAVMDALYLDLESDEDMTKLADPEFFLTDHAERLVILDEIQRYPDLFRHLRGLIDKGRRQGKRAGRFLLLGSASIELLKQTAETLAGRISYLELCPFDVHEVGEDEAEKLWVRGGFPDSFLETNDRHSMEWRRDFIRTYLERDIPQMGFRIPATTLRRFWTMLAHVQGNPPNLATLSRSLGVDGKTVARYLDLLTDLLLIRKIAPWQSNVGKRLVKSPKVYLRDSGITHTLLGLGTKEAIVGHPIAGKSWEGFVIENLLAVAPPDHEVSFYRTASGTEIDIILTLTGRKPWVIEIKRSLSPKPNRGFHNACADINPEARFIVYPGREQFRIADNTTVISLNALMEKILLQGSPSPLP